jgi:hypothetical protein
VSLPSYLEALRNHACTIKNAIDTYEQCEIKHLWTGTDSAKRKDKAFRDIEARVLKMAEVVGVLPEKELFYRRIIDGLRDQLEVSHAARR